MRINAYAVLKKGGAAEPFFYERELTARDVLVKITHCSVARGDVQYVTDDWGDARFPLVPGHEIVGVVSETGAEVADLRPGDRVGVGYQHGACFECDDCRQGTEQLCPRQEVVAVDRYGGWAEHVVVDDRFAFRLPAALDSAAGAPLLSSGLTVFTAIRRAELAPASRVAVMGVGGLGHLAIQFLHRMGHQVSALSRSPSKRPLIERLGGTYVDVGDLEQRARCWQSFDLILSTVNVPFDLDSCVRMLKPKGRLGLVAGPLEPLELSAGLLSNSMRAIYGNYIGSRADTADMLRFAAEHGIAAVVEVMPFSRIDEAIGRVRGRDVPLGLVLEHQ